MDGTLACKSEYFLCKVAELFKQVLSGIWSDPLKVSSAETVCTATHDITVGSTELAPRLEWGGGVLVSFKVQLPFNFFPLRPGDICIPLTEFTNGRKRREKANF